MRSARTLSANDLRENRSARVLENTATEIRQAVPSVGRRYGREKKSLCNNMHGGGSGVRNDGTVSSLDEVFTNTIICPSD
jgi:hypothetical protein